MHWQRWHAQYDDLSSPLARRLRIVQRHIADWLDESPHRDVRVVSACAGEGRNLLPVLAGRSDAQRVRALLIEADPRNIWTRSRRPPDLTPSIRRWFRQSGFAEQAFEAPPDEQFAVGVHVLARRDRPTAAPQRLFTFALPHSHP